MTAFVHHDSIAALDFVNRRHVAAYEANVPEIEIVGRGEKDRIFEASSGG